MQSMDVVKGVEKRLEGSQVQLASSVSELKQQLQKVSHSLDGGFICCGTGPTLNWSQSYFLKE